MSSGRDAGLLDIEIQPVEEFLARELQRLVAHDASICPFIGGSWYCRCLGPRSLLLCRVTLGDPYYMKSEDSLVSLVGLRRPPNRPGIPGAQYDSVIAKRGIRHGKTWQKHKEFVLFDGARAYPEFHAELQVLSS